MPHAVRFVLLHATLGFAIAGLFVAAPLASDTGGLATLMLGAESHPMPVLLLWILCGLTFGAVQIGAAVMLLAEEDDRPSSGRRMPIGMPEPLRVPVRARVRRR